MATEAEKRIVIKLHRLKLWVRACGAREKAVVAAAVLGGRTQGTETHSQNCR